MSTATSSLAVRGFSLVELAVVLAILALITWAVSAAFVNVGPVRDRDRANALGATLRESLRGFALVNGRLPCPDQTANGWEGSAAGVCGTVQVGWLPYRTLGLDLPADAYRAAYAVFRSPNTATPTADADLSVTTERTGDLPGSATYQDTHDLIAGLNNAANQSLTPSTAHPHVTGDGGRQGAVDCSANVFGNAAYWLVFPLEDRDVNGSQFDGANGPVNLCVQSPTTPFSSTQDDVSLVESFSTLSGWLHTRSP